MAYLCSQSLTNKQAGLKVLDELDRQHRGSTDPSVADCLVLSRQAMATAHHWVSEFETETERGYCSDVALFRLTAR